MMLSYYYGLDCCRSDVAPSTSMFPYLDERRNPKFWALWFREFLSALFAGGKRGMAAAKERDSVTPRQTHRIRSGTLRTREWKMKLWVQSLTETI